MTQLCSKAGWACITAADRSLHCYSSTAYQKVSMRPVQRPTLTHRPETWQSGRDKLSSADPSGLCLPPAPTLHIMVTLLVQKAGQGRTPGPQTDHRDVQAHRAIVRQRPRVAAAAAPAESPPRCSSRRLPAASAGPFCPHRPLPETGAPVITRLEAGKAILRGWDGEVVALGTRIGEEAFIHHAEERPPPSIVESRNLSLLQ